MGSAGPSRRRGKGHANVRTIINATARLSESLRAPPDHGTVPSALSRRDAENFLNRFLLMRVGWPDRGPRSLPGSQRWSTS